MRIKLLKPWHGRKVGTVIDVPDGAANALIHRGFAVEPRRKAERATKPRGERRSTK